ncbi:MAG: hypothetical protein C0626_02100 [Arcobacter sp.]|uniref:hypothetical protein n=1 Tax=uncultured Arcobacter sp. TaxID=165434 RepID=UPI000CC98BE6|nr:hypothetical protein [uncultured Arcobacter sp.]PLY11384.1 MAG: hypothetical protein C0626_02100 [Arcobacter sp.]
MGGGGGSQSTYTYTTLDIKPVTNVDIDTKVIADAIENGNDIERVKLALVKAGLEQEQQKQQLETANFLQKTKAHEQLMLVGLIIGGSYIYKHLKKG